VLLITTCLEQKTIK